MGRDRSGRGGLPPSEVALVLRLIANYPELNIRQLMARTGLSKSSIRRLLRGIHRSQQPVDRRGLDATRRERVLELLAAAGTKPNFSKIGKQAGGVDRRVVRSLYLGQHISQRGR